MSTVIDSLIVKLGLDPKDFTKGQKEALASFKKTGESAQKTGKTIEKSSKDAANSIGKIRDQAIELFALFTAGKGLKQFVSDITSANTALGNLSKTLGVSGTVYDSLGKAVEAAGGSYSAAVGSARSFNQSLQELATTGKSAIVPYLRALQAATGVDLTTKGKTTLQVMSSIADALKKVKDTQGAGRATYLAGLLGFSDPAEVALLERGGKAFREAVAEAKNYAASQGDIDAATARTKAFNLLGLAIEKVGRSILTWLTPHMDAVADWIRGMIDAHPEAAAAVLTTLSGAITALGSALTVYFTASALSTILGGLGKIRIALIALGDGEVMAALGPLGLALGAIVGAIAAIKSIPGSKPTGSTGNNRNPGFGPGAPPTYSPRGGASPSPAAPGASGSTPSSGAPAAPWNNDSGGGGGRGRLGPPTYSPRAGAAPSAPPNGGSGSSPSSGATESQSTSDAGSIYGLTPTATAYYETTLGRRESGNRYRIGNRYGYEGRWQMGAGALKDTGYVTTDKNGRLNDPSVWTGKDGISSLSDFLNNKNGVQDKQFAAYTNMHYQQLARSGVIKPGMSQEEIAGYLAAAHLKGVKGATNLARGIDSADANGTRTSSYYGMMRGIGRARLPAGAGAGASVTNSSVNNSRSSNVRSNMHIDQINIHTAATKADHIASHIGPAIQRNALAMQYNYGIV